MDSSEDVGSRTVPVTPTRGLPNFQWQQHLEAMNLNHTFLSGGLQYARDCVGQGISSMLKILRGMHEVKLGVPGTPSSHQMETVQRRGPGAVTVVVNSG